MDPAMAREWAQSFEDKSESELREMFPPEGLDSDGRVAWRSARRHAVRVLEEAPPAPPVPKREVLPTSHANDDAIAKDRTPILNELLNREERTRLLLNEMHDAELRAKARESAAQISLTLPEGDAAMLLEKQIASSAALIGYLSNYVARTDTDPSVCMSFMDRMTAMLGASANVGKVVGRLRGQVSRSEQNINVNRMAGERGRG